MPKLNIRQKWHNQKKKIAVGDIVLVMASDTPRGRWPLGRVSEIFPGADGNVRVVDVIVSGKAYRRPITVLVPL